MKSVKSMGYIQDMNPVAEPLPFLFKLPILTAERARSEGNHNCLEMVSSSITPSIKPQMEMLLMNNEMLLVMDFPIFLYLCI